MLRKHAPCTWRQSEGARHVSHTAIRRACSSLRPGRSSTAVPLTFLAIPKVTVDEVQHLVPSCEAALEALMACGCTLPHVRMPLTRCQPVVQLGYTHVGMPVEVPGDMTLSVSTTDAASSRALLMATAWVKCLCIRW
jgi:hypothetical protein